MNDTLMVIGEALIDFIPTEQGMALKDVCSFTKHCGGAPINIAAATAKLGAHSKVLTQVGADAFGDFILETLSLCQVDITAVKRTKQYPTALAFVALDEKGNRDFTFYRDPCADLHLSAEDITATMFQDCGILHFCSVDLVDSPMKQAHLKAIQLAKEQGAIISFDPNVRLPLWSSKEDCKNTILEFAPYADILKISDDELFFLTGQKDCEQVFTVFPDATIILLTCGEQGSYLMTKEHRLYEKPIPVKAIDTTGAGDAFAAAFLYQLLRDGISREQLPHLSKDILQVYLRFSNAYAADSTTKYGAVHAVATTQEFHEFLQNFHISNVIISDS